MSVSSHSLLPRTLADTILFAALIICLGLLSLDLIGNPHSVRGLLGIPSYVFAGLFVIGSVIARCFTEVKQPLWLSKVIGVVGVLALVVGTSLTVWTYLTPPNVVYALTRVNLIPLLILSVFCLAIVALNQKKQWWSQRLPLLITISPFALLGFSYVVSLLPFDAFVPYASEDGTMEYLQVLILIMTIVVSAWQAWLSYHRRKLAQAVLFGCIALGVFFITMEEISWGQRLLNLETPENLATVNVQNEITLHNIGIFNDLQLVVYIGVTLVGSILSWSQTRLISAYWFMWNPPRSAFGLFFIPFVFYSGFVFFDTPFHLWAEVIEVLFYFGIFLWVAQGSSEVLKLIQEHVRFT
jgi:hypothetical protein